MSSTAKSSASCGNGLDTLADYATELCRVGRSLFERGYVHGSTGNISMRIPARLGGGYLLTPTDACLGFLEPQRLAVLDDAGVQLAGDRASKTLVLHLAIYQAAPWANCVIHTHSSWLVDLTLRGVWSVQDILPPITPYYLMKVGHVPLIPYCRPGDPQVAEHIQGLIALQQHAGGALKAVMCERLGPQVWGETAANAMATLEELEETAKLWLRGGRCATPLSEDAIDSLRKQFNIFW